MAIQGHAWLLSFLPHRNCLVNLHHKEASHFLDSADFPQLICFSWDLNEGEFISIRAVYLFSQSQTPASHSSVFGLGSLNEAKSSSSKPFHSLASICVSARDCSSLPGYQWSVSITPRASQVEG